MQTFADKVIHFNTHLHYTGKLPQGINIMNPFAEQPMVVNVMRQFYKKFYDDNHTRSHDPYKASEWKELLARLDESVEMLPPKRRKIFRLVREEGFRPREVAEIMNISPRTVETQLFKAVKTLHAVLRPHLPVRQKAASTAAGEAFLLSLLLVFSSF